MKSCPGRTKDKNIGFIAEYLTAIGIDLKEVRVVPDEEPEIVAALNALRIRYTYVFTTGGIGPTHDDITADAVAKAFGVSIDYHPRAVEILRERLAQTGGEEIERGAHAHDARARRGRIGAQQDLGGAGSTHRQRHRHGGHPQVMQAMLEYVTPQLKTGAKMLSDSVRADCREGDIGTELGAIAKAHPDVIIGSYPFMDENRGANAHVVMRTRDPQRLASVKAEVEAMLARVHAQLAAKEYSSSASSAFCCACRIRTALRALRWRL